MAIRPVRRQRPRRTSEEVAAQSVPAHRLAVTELATDVQGALSPFGRGVFPIPLRVLRYQHPGPAERPRLLVDQDGGDHRSGQETSRRR